MKLHSLFNHHNADGGVGEVFESTKYFRSFRGKLRWPWELNALQLKKTHASGQNTSKVRKHLHQFHNTTHYRNALQIQKLVFCPLACVFLSCSALSSLGHRSKQRCSQIQYNLSKWGPLLQNINKKNTYIASILLLWCHLQHDFVVNVLCDPCANTASEEDIRLA